MKSERAHRSGETGFTFIELLVTMMILIFILYAAYMVIDKSQRIAVHQDEIAEMDSAGRVGMDLMATEIREVGANPLKLKTAHMNPANANWISVESSARMGLSIDLRMDMNGDGDTLDPNEYVRYEWIDVVNNLGRLVRRADTDGNGTIDSTVTLAKNVRKAKRLSDPSQTDNIFKYLDGGGNEITDVALVPTGARTVSIQFTVQSSRPDRVSKKYREVTMRQNAVLRNLRVFPL